MTLYFGIPLSKEYLDLSSDLRSKASHPESSSQAGAAVKSMNLLIDIYMSALIEELVVEVKMTPFAENTFFHLSGLLKKTCHAVISRVIAKLSNAQIASMFDYYHELEIIKDGVVRLSFPLENEVAQCAQQCFDEINEDQIDKEKISALGAKLSDMMSEVVEQLLLVYIKHPMTMIKLGGMGRKILDISCATASKGTKLALKKVLTNMNQEELDAYCKYIRNYFIQVDGTEAVKTA